MKFGYPVDTKHYVFKNLSDYIIIENVGEMMDGLHVWFFGLVCVLGEYQDKNNQY